MRSQQQEQVHYGDTALGHNLCAESHPLTMSLPSRLAKRIVTSKFQLRNLKTLINFTRMQSAYLPEAEDDISEFSGLV